MSDAKLKEGIFDGPQILKLLKDDVFVTKMTTQKRAWLSFKNVIKQFLGHVKIQDWKKNGFKECLIVSKNWSVQWVWSYMSNSMLYSNFKKLQISSSMFDRIEINHKLIIFETFIWISPKISPKFKIEK